MLTPQLAQANADLAVVEFADAAIRNRSTKHNEAAAAALAIHIAAMTKIRSENADCTGVIAQVC